MIHVMASQGYKHELEQTDVDADFQAAATLMILSRHKVKKSKRTHANRLGVFEPHHVMITRSKK